MDEILVSHTRTSNALLHGSTLPEGLHVCVCLSVCMCWSLCGWGQWVQWSPGFVRCSMKSRIKGSKMAIKRKKEENQTV